MLILRLAAKKNLVYGEAGSAAANKFKWEYFMKDDRDYIQECEALALKAAAKGNQPVGAVIVRKAEMVCRAEEAGKSKNDVTCHAELEAIRQAVTELKTNDLSDCTLYSTHEPCIMCSYAIRFHKIGKVVYKNKVKYLGGVSSSMPLLTTTEVPSHWNEPPVVICVGS